MRSLPAGAEVLFVLVTFPTSWIKALCFGISLRMLNQLVAIESLLVIEVMSTKDAVEVFEGRRWHCVFGASGFEFLEEMGFMEFLFCVIYSSEDL
jgi:hypothetical protein